MDYLLDNPEAEQLFQEILSKIKPLQNIEVVNSMQKRGVDYKVNLGVSIPLLQDMASDYEKNHLLALKLWNKQWRETMILAMLLEEPEKITENQMDFWVKNFQSIEIAEQAAMNLFSKTGFAYKKAFEYCLGKKLLVKIVGLLMIGRLALTDREAADENFDSFFELMPPLSKDPQLSIVFSRIYIQIGMRNLSLNETAISYAKILKTIDSKTAQENADHILSELDCEDARAIIKRRK
ncbi:MAG TPA: DNA alkylation repair protein [Prolixibacteraceae bacterium]|nr:DNA alkylation repair protein [Prolixibacteraceae bacterium]